MALGSSSFKLIRDNNLEMAIASLPNVLGETIRELCYLVTIIFTASSKVWNRYGVAVEPAAGVEGSDRSPAEL